MQLKNYTTEIIITIVIAIWLLFTATNVNIRLGETYLNFMWIGLGLLIIGITIFDKKLHITFQRQSGGHLKAIGMGFIGYAILLIISVFVMKTVDPTKANIGAIILLIGATTPALATSKIANWLNFSIAIPYAETQLWARAKEFFADVFGIRLTKENIKSFGVIVLITILSMIFVFFHLTSKGVTATSSLVVVFVMMMISLFMVIYFQETRQAVYMHCIANGIGAYLMLFG